MDNSEISFSDLLKKFDFKPELKKPSRYDTWMVIQIYTNSQGQKVEITYSYEDDYLSIDIEHQSGKSVGGSFEAMIHLETWENLFNKNIINH